MRRVAIYGAGYLGQQILHHLLNYYADSVQVVGFFDDTKAPGEPVTHDLESLGSLASVKENPELQPRQLKLVFGIGYSDMQMRRQALERALHAGYRLFTVIHPKAIVEPGADPGPGSVVLGGAVLDQHVKLGAACFVDIGVRLGAGTTAGKNNYFSSGTSTGSRVSIGDDCFVGMDCTITTDVHIGSNLFINAKTLVSRNIGSNIKLVELHRSKELPQITKRD